MAIKNPKDLLLEATKYPAAIEAKLPEGAPKVSTMLTDAANKIPAVPDFPMEIPDLPAAPELPALPTGLRRLGRPYVTGVEVVPVPTRATRTREIVSSPAAGVLPEVISTRGL